MKKKVMYFLINDQFSYQKINKKSLFWLKMAQKQSFFLNFNNDFYIYFAKFVKKNFFESLISIPRKKPKKRFFLDVTNFE
jgi:hypothetical protein